MNEGIKKKISLHKRIVDSTYTCIKVANRERERKKGKKII
jgi:hypothetical protein